MTETLDRLKILSGNSAYPRGGTCKICGFSDADLPEGQRTSFRFSDVCGDHDCRVKAGVCDCMACKKQKKADVEREIRAVAVDVVAIRDCAEPYEYEIMVESLAKRAEKLLGGE